MIIYCQLTITTFQDLTVYDIEHASGQIEKERNPPNPPVVLDNPNQSLNTLEGRRVLSPDP